MYIKLQHGQPIKYSIYQLKRDNPGTSFPDRLPDALLAQFDVYPLTPVAPPTPDPRSERVVEGTPALIDGKWTQTWQIVALTPEEAAAARLSIMQSIVDATQERLDTFARTRQYDGVLSLSTYINDANLKFKAEGEYGVSARGATWSKLYEMLAEVEAGTREMPKSFADVEPELPPLIWPD